MKKCILLVFSIFIILLFLSTALAEKPLSMLCDSVFDLLFETDNVTIDGEIVFSLDETEFKRAKAKYIQDSDRSYWDLKLYSPKNDGSIRENGYTIIADGSKIYVMEVYRPGIYKTGTNAPQSTILRKSVQMNLMKKLFRSVSEQAETETMKHTVQIVEDAEEQEIRIELKENLPESFQMAFNFMTQYAAKRYFGIDYDRLNERNIPPMSAYATIKEGILSCTKSVALDQLKLTVKNDSNGRPERISGDSSIILITAKDGEKTLDIHFSIDISDYGTSHVDTFIPSDYDVKLADGAMDIENVEYTEVDDDTQDKLIEQAKKAWSESGYILNPSTYGYAYKQNGRYQIELCDDSGNLNLNCIIDAEGKILELRNSSNLWQDRNFNYDKSYPDFASAEEAATRIMMYLEKTNPEARGRINHLKIQCWMDQDDEVYLEFCEDPIAQDWDGILVVVRIKPDWELEYYSCFSNG